MRIVYCHFLASCISRFVFRLGTKSNNAQKKKCVGELLCSAFVQTVYIFSPFLPFFCLFLSFSIPFPPFRYCIPPYSALYSLISFPYLLSLNYLPIFLLRSLMLYNFLYQYSLLLFLPIPLFILAFYPLCSFYNVLVAFV